MGKRKNRGKKKRSSKKDSLSIDDYWPSEPAKTSKDDILFIASDTFIEKRDGYVFRTGEQGVGYYKDVPNEGNHPVEQPSKPISEEEQKKQQELNMKLRILIKKYDIREKNMQKAHRLWLAVTKLPECKDVPNPCQWILGHEHFVKYWKSLKTQANAYKPPNEDAPLPKNVLIIMSETSPLRRYMEYMYVYFVD